MKYYVGIDIGGTKINTGIFFSGEKKLIASKKTYVKNVDNLSVHIRETINELCKENNIDPKGILSCGIGIPGTVSADGKKILNKKTEPLM